ncbi:glutaredoxin family protein [Aquibacillus saliphilus]|uniref:glutaredoxin family protein n=1 Tax=Aquibacillus saliphilus TaxID=1909422 RepID=UPI001CF0B0DD|nr:glutaredoxin family protein [Aquibacillus saliphilus]
MANVTVYTKYGCPQCEMTKTVLQGEGIEFNTINVEDDQNALNYVKNELGFSAMPVIIKDGIDPIVGFNPDRLKELQD